MLNLNALKDSKFVELQILRYTRVVLGLTGLPFLLAKSFEQSHIQVLKEIFSVEIIDMIRENLNAELFNLL